MISKTLKAEVIEAVRKGKEGTNTSMQLDGVFTGLINYRDEGLGLEDVLVFLEEKKCFGVFVAVDGEILSESGGSGCYYDLTKTLEDQKPELFQFLHSLL